MNRPQWTHTQSLTEATTVQLPLTPTPPAPDEESPLPCDDCGSTDHPVCPSCWNCASCASAVPDCLARCDFARSWQ